jgi:hypothetical protein
MWTATDISTASLPIWPSTTDLSPGDYPGCGSRRERLQRALILLVASWLDLTRISAISRIVATLFSNALLPSSASFSARSAG